MREEAPQISALLVVRHGYIVFERYYGDYEPGSYFSVASITKSALSALVGIAMRKGLLESVEQPIADFFPGAETHGLTLERLLTLTSGWPYREFREAPKTVPEMLATPLSWRPGERFSYGETPPHLTSAILAQLAGCSTASFARRELFEPIGMWRDAEHWQDRPGTQNLGSEPVDGLPWRCDADGITAGGYGLHLTLRDMARFGLLYASDGLWAGEQFIPADWVSASGAPHSPGGSPMWMPYGYFWWLPVWHRGGARLAAGFGGQEIYVNPELDLVVAIACTLRDDQPPDNRKITAQYLLPAIRDWPSPSS